MIFEYDTSAQDSEHAIGAAREAYRRLNGKHRLLLYGWPLAVFMAITMFDLFPRLVPQQYASEGSRYAGYICMAIGTCLMVRGAWPRQVHAPVEQYVNVPSRWRDFFRWGVVLATPLLAYLVELALNERWPPLYQFTPSSTVQHLHRFRWGVVLLWLTGYIAFAFFRTLLRAMRRARRSRRSSHIRVEATDTSLIVETPAGESRIRWDAVRRFVETPKVFLVYVLDRNYFVFPKRALSPMGVEELRSLLRRNVLGTARGFPVQTLQPS